ncbi:extracellular catalytic domain type 2 short-chain-length polyhydroxyalkanoate depolymerase [Azospirillum sp. sgz302134]
MSPTRILGAAAVALSTILTVPALADQPIKLPKLNIDAKQTTTSGVSSGAYMATQMHVAYSDVVAGAALVAGGPYGCADNIPGTLPAEVALYRCMATTAGKPDLGQLVQNVQSREKMGSIANLNNLKTSRVYLFNGVKDTVVTTPVVQAADQLYRALKVPADNIKFVSNPDAEHAFVTSNYGSACDFLGANYLNNCNYDQAGALLSHLYPDVKTPNAEQANAQPVKFSQVEYIGDQSRSGMLEYGYVYIPESCANGQACRLHIAFHGCEMSAEKIGDAFAVHAGYNRWADVNNIVVLYPQIKHSAKPTSNPKGCWDWFAYTGYDYNQKSGIQPTAIRKMIAALAK